MRVCGILTKFGDKYIKSLENFPSSAKQYELEYLFLIILHITILSDYL